MVWVEKQPNKEKYQTARGKTQKSNCLLKGCNLNILMVYIRLHYIYIIYVCSDRISHLYYCHVCP